MSTENDLSKSGSISTMRQTVIQLARLCEISVTLNSTLEINTLLNHILNIAKEVLDCDATSIMLYDENKGQLLFTAATGSDSTKLKDIPVPLEGSIAGTIFTSNESLLINDAASDPRHFTKVGEKVDFSTRNLVGVPMTMRDKVVGVLEALNKKNNQDFTSRDVRLLSIIASQAAVALHNARLLTALKQAYDDLSRVDKLKSDFMAIASHELRTPLGVILGYASFLKEETENELSEFADKVLNSAMHLRTLIEDMTNMNLMQMGSIDLMLQPIAIQKIIQEAYEENTQALKAKGHQFILKAPEEPITVLADRDKMRHVFVNVLNNAVRFTKDKGMIAIQVAVNKKEVWCTVRDNGIGIPSHELENIFDEFYQVEDHMVRRFGGLGLGLAIARGLVTLHKGRIWAESEGRDKGTSIFIVLPLAESNKVSPLLET